MNISIILLGIGLLVALAVLAGRADGGARADAWKGIAAQRRANWEERQRLADNGEALAQTAGVCPCPGCQLIRHLFGRGDDPRGLW